MRRKLQGTPLTPARFERLAAGVPARLLAKRAGIDETKLYRAEKGLAVLTPEEEADRVVALRILSEPEPEAATR